MPTLHAPISIKMQSSEFVVRKKNGGAGKGRRAHVNGTIFEGHYVRQDKGGKGVEMNVMWWNTYPEHGRVIVNTPQSRRFVNG